MRVLIASKRAPDRPGRKNGGVQTWTLTVAAEFRRLGHQVAIADTLIPASGQFDLGIFANARYTRQFWALCERSILISHGIVDDERPEDGCSDYRITSEGVRDHWGLNAPIVRQPIDLEFWSDIGAKRSGLVRYSSRGGMEWLDAKPLRNVSHEAARDALRRAECVYATGRAALEAAACGAPVVILDNRGYQGELLAEFGTAQMRNNYSGRGGKIPTPAKVKELTEQAIQKGSQRGYVEWFHDVRNIVGELI